LELLAGKLSDESRFTVHSKFTTIAFSGKVTFTVNAETQDRQKCPLSNQLVFLKQLK